MPPADNSTPDFDSMTPEELMAWMETLAKRQGADEGFTTSANAQIAEIDPSTVQDTGPGYIPYGMSQEQWEKKQADEAAKKAARQAAAPPPPTPAPVTPPPPPAVAAAPAPAASSSEMPDFDKMTPEELMAWMETLAERQGASEGFTTTSRVQIAEVDPTTVKDTGPGYIPYGMTQEQWEKKQADEAAKKAARQPAAPPPSTPIPAAPPVFDLPPLPSEPSLFESTTEVTPAMGGMDWLESLAGAPSADVPQFDLSGLGAELPTLDLDALSSPLNLDALQFLSDAPAQPAPAAPQSSPLDWLQGLSQAEENPFNIPTTAPEPPSAALPSERFSSPAAAPVDSGDVDTLEWLESLAKRQGVDEAELATPASLNIPLPETPAPQSGYTGYTFENEKFTPPNEFPLDLDAIEESEADDALSWLDQLASGQTPEEPVDPTVIIEEAKKDRVMQALSSGQNLSADEIKGWMDNMMDKGMVLSDDTGFVVEEAEAEVVDQLQAQIPDWLLDQVGPPPAELNIPAPRLPETPAFTQSAPETAAVEFPDWLQENAAAEDTFENIFAQADEDQSTRPLPDLATSAAAQAVTAAQPIEVDVNDPWVEAFELERQIDASDEIPTWYSARINQIHSGEDLPEAPAAFSLQQTVLPPETELPHGELETLPAWLTGEAVPTPSIQMEAPAELPLAASSVPAEVLSFLEADEDEQDAVSDMPDWLREQVTDVLPITDDTDDMPDWLKEAGVDATDTVPDWLIDTITVEIEQPPVLAPAAPTPAAAPVMPVVPVVAASPAPVPVAARQIDIGSTLQSARGKISSGDLDGGLSDYEQVVRANAGLDAVVGDLGTLVKQESYKNSAGVYRVLGDGLMRLGRLQEALDTYRKALNLL